MDAVDGTARAFRLGVAEPIAHSYGHLHVLDVQIGPDKRHEF
jgi:hypothetical protein